jgi:hypothetical protein
LILTQNLVATVLGLYLVSIINGHPNGPTQKGSQKQGGQGNDNPTVGFFTGVFAIPLGH